MALSFGEDTSLSGYILTPEVAHGLRAEVVRACGNCGEPRAAVAAEEEGSSDWRAFKAKRQLLSFSFPMPLR